ncbi:hypothetical protein UFOVP22_58 [uncultured Caudovirales phage]|uniref:Uncharacterized protein n=1 Tax=uncultured Caudovirales phage TaxID=2100421 RepID=A0A6J5T8B2_9CAUD|nr:hypothetical protein UFOVP22_58 [uncultured Caudovirales phage]
MAKFQCQVSGNFIEVVGESDIKDMLAHPQYKLYEEPIKTNIKEIVKATPKSKE